MHGVPSSPRRFSLFKSGDVSTYSTSTGSFELGILFTVDVVGYLVAARYAKPAGDSNSGRPVSLWNSAGGVLLSRMTTANEPNTGGWVEYPFPAPYQLSPGTVYVLSRSTVDAAGTYWFLSNAWATGKDSPPLHAPVSAGQYNGSIGFCPSGQFQQSDYAIEPVVLF